MKVQIQLLRAALDKLLDHAESVHGTSIEVDSDLYWFVPKAVLDNPDSEPKGLTLGSLEDDWSEVAAIGNGSKEAFGYGLVWASTVLRATGDRTR